MVHLEPLFRCIYNNANIILLKIHAAVLEKLSDCVITYLYNCCMVNMKDFKHNNYLPAQSHL